MSQKSAVLIQLASCVENIAAAAFGMFLHRRHVDKSFDAFNRFRRAIEGILREPYARLRAARIALIRRPNFPGSIL